MKIIPPPLLSPNPTSSQKLNSLSNSVADSQNHVFRVNIVQSLDVEGSGDDEPENVHRVGKEQTEEVRRCEHLRTLLWRKKYMSYEESN